MRWIWNDRTHFRFWKSNNFGILHFNFMFVLRTSCSCLFFYIKILQLSCLFLQNLQIYYSCNSLSISLRSCYPPYWPWNHSILQRKQSIRPPSNLIPNKKHWRTTHRTVLRYWYRIYQSLIFVLCCWSAGSARTTSDLFGQSFLR